MSESVKEVERQTMYNLCFDIFLYDLLHDKYVINQFETKLHFAQRIHEENLKKLQLKHASERVEKKWFNKLESIISDKSFDEIVKDRSKYQTKLDFISIKKSTKKVTKRATKRSIEKATKRETKRSIKKVTKRATKKATKRATKKVTKRVTKKQKSI